MVSNQQLMANAMGGKSARACDSCIRKRARWYCAADDAFLCQSCDSSVHSANPLARRHERLRLQISSIKSSSSSSSDHEQQQQQLLPPPLHNLFIPAWQRGMTKKPRTPRRHVGKKYWQLPLVPETEETNSSFDEEEQMHYQVPIFDPLCTSVNSTEEATKSEFLGPPMHVGFLPSEIELAEFAADVETLLGNGLEEEPFDMEALGILAYKEKYDQKDSSSSSSSLLVKVEDDNYDINGKIILLDEEQDLDDLDISFDYDEEESPAIYEGDTKMEVKLEEETTKENNNSMILLRLNYEGVIKAWDDKKSPWTSGGRPELKSTECWPDCMERCGMVHQQQQTTYGDMINIGMMGRHGHGHGTIVADEGREARVSRYREKRRTRLFSKKIRYEVRKLNAEKRPRMKGRFVKRTNLTVGTHVQPPVFSINA